LEELLPLESYLAHTEWTVRRLATPAGAAFGLAMGSALGIGIVSAVGPIAAVVSGIAAAAVTGAIFASIWGSALLRLRRARDERAHENDPKLMGESLEDSFRYRMPCSLVDGERLVSGTLYLDRGRGAFVPIRKLAKQVETRRFGIDPSAFSVGPWHDAPWPVRWVLGREALTLQLAGGGEVLRFVTPDCDLAMANLREALPAHVAEDPRPLQGPL
jgi:hypothetical protein